MEPGCTAINSGALPVVDIPEKFLRQIQEVWLDAAKHVEENGGSYEFSVKLFKQEKAAPIQTIVAASITRQYRS